MYLLIKNCMLKPETWRRIENCTPRSRNPSLISRRVCVEITHSAFILERPACGIRADDLYVQFFSRVWLSIRVNSFFAQADARKKKFFCSHPFLRSRHGYGQAATTAHVSSDIAMPLELYLCHLFRIQYQMTEQHPTHPTFPTQFHQLRPFLLKHKTMCVIDSKRFVYASRVFVIR